MLKSHKQIKDKIPLFLSFSLIILLLNFSCSNTKKRNENRDQIKHSEPEYKSTSKELPVVDKKLYGLMLNNEVMYYDSEDEKGIELRLKLISKKKIYYDFTIKSGDSILFSQQDTLIKETNDYKQTSSKSGYPVKGPYFFKRDQMNTRTQLILQDEDADYAWFNIYNSGSSEYSLQKKCDLKSVPFLIREGAEPPFKVILNHIANNAKKHKSSLQYNPKDSLEIQKLYQANKDFIRTLDQARKSSMMDSITKDTLFLEKAIFYSLDIIHNKLVEAGLSGFELTDKNVVQKVNVNELSSLKVLVKLDHYENVISKKFEEYSTSSSYRFSKTDRLGHTIFKVATRENLYQFGDNYLIIMRGEDRRESDPYIFSIWSKKENYYFLESIVDTTMRLFYGVFEKLNIIDLEGDSHLIIAKTSGADGDYGWGSFGLGKLSNLNKLDIIYNYRWNNNIMGGEYLKDTLEQENSRIIMEKYFTKYYEVEGQKDGIYKDSLIRRDTIHYQDLLIEGKKTDHNNGS